MKKRLNLNTIGVKSMAKFHLLFIALHVYRHVTGLSPG